MKRPLKVLVACESSGAVRREFHKLGHDAWSCDLRPADDGSCYHIQGDVRDVLGDGWDLMIAHPPCTYLCASGMHWTRRGLRDPQLTEDALAFVRLLMDAPIPRICIENPVGVISTRIRPADQYIQPYQFGEDASKKTGLWLKNLPKLEPTEYIEPRYVNGKPRWGNQTDSGQNRLGPSEYRWKVRSKTYWGIANAMATQWGGYSGWTRVVFGSSCHRDEDGELTSICPGCGDDYIYCACPGPTMDDYEYEEFNGTLFARPKPKG